MLPLLYFRKSSNSILERCHPFIKIAIFLSGLIYLFTLSSELKLKSLLRPFIFIFVLFILSGGWSNRKIYGFMLFPFLSFSFFLIIPLFIIYLFKYGPSFSPRFYLEKLSQLSPIFIKGIFIISLAYVFIIIISQRELLYALKKMKMPTAIVSQLILILSFLQLLVNEFRWLPLALRSRGMVKVRARGKIKNLSPHQKFWCGDLLYSIFFRTLKRGEQFEYALFSRGFQGDFFTLYSPAWKRLDSLILFLFIISLIFLNG